MLKGLTLLVAFQLAGEWLKHLLGLPIPGSVIGMLLLLATLYASNGKPDAIKTASNTLLPWLPLFLTPACVGLMQHWQLLLDSFWTIAIALTLSFIVAFIFTPLLLQALLKRHAEKAHLR